MDVREPVASSPADQPPAGGGKMETVRRAAQSHGSAGRHPEIQKSAL